MKWKIPPHETDELKVSARSSAGRRAFLCQIAKTLAFTRFAIPLSLLSSRSANAQDPATALALASTVVNLISEFSQKSDGGLAAMLSAEIDYQVLSLSLLNQVVVQLSNIQIQIQDLRDYLPIALEASRLKEYYDGVCSSASNTSILIGAYKNASASDRPSYEHNFETIYAGISDVRGKLENYSSFDAALAYAVCLGTELTLILRLGRDHNFINETLRHYVSWADRILDSNTSGTLAFNTLSAAAEYLNKYEDPQTGLQTISIETDCIKFTFHQAGYCLNDGACASEFSSPVVVARQGTPAKRTSANGLQMEWYPAAEKNVLIGFRGDCDKNLNVEVSLTDELGNIPRGLRAQHWLDKAFNRPEVTTMDDRLQANITSALGGANRMLLQVALESTLATSVRQAQAKAHNTIVQLGGD